MIDLKFEEYMIGKPNDKSFWTDRKIFPRWFHLWGSYQNAYCIELLEQKSSIAGVFQVH